MVKKNLFVVTFLLSLVALTMVIFTEDDKETKASNKKNDDKETKALNKKYDDKECKLSKITTIDLKKAIEASNISIVDVNGSKSFAKGHIKGAHDITAQGLEGRLPKDKTSLVVVYFNGEQCSADKDACKKCAASTDLREKCSADKKACDKCAGDLDLRDKCTGNKNSLESSNATKEAAEKIKALGYSNIKCYCAGLDGWIAAGGTTANE